MLFSNIDLTEILMYLFTIFFFGLILYLRREDRREGYPLEEDTTGRLEPITVGAFYAEPKTFRLHNGTEVIAPSGKREGRELALKRTAVWPGAPYEPTGDALADGVGPASYALRADVPDELHHGGPKIVPLAKAAGFGILKGDADFRGWTVVGADRRVAGTVSEVWVDQAESLIRYFEVDQGEGGRRSILVPMMMAVIDRGQKRVRVDSAAAEQFAGAPVLKSPDQITLLEEDKVQGYFGGGYLYAWPKRKDPLA